MQFDELQISCIGAGNMASAIIEGLLENGFPSSHITASDPSQDKLDGLRDKLAIRVTTNNAEAVATADVLVIAVKPQVLEQVLTPLKSALQERRPVIVSIAAGIEMRSLQHWAGDTMPIVRCMPNTPAQVLEGASGLYANAHVAVEQKRSVEQIFSSIGYATWVEQEELIHTVTALSGSGPAYIFLMIAEMAAAGEKLGLDSQAAERLAAQTVLGAAKMVLESDLPPHQLKKNVMSPGGTTERAIGVFEGSADETSVEPTTYSSLGALVDTAMTAAADRSKELAALLAGKGD